MRLHSKAILYSFALSYSGFFFGIFFYYLTYSNTIDLSNLLLFTLDTISLFGIFPLAAHALIYYNLNSKNYKLKKAIKKLKEEKHEYSKGQDIQDLV